MKDQNIVVFGGGTGAPLVSRALMLADFQNIKVISAAMDSGGRTGWVRTDERDHVISVSDLWRNLLGLIAPEDDSLANIKAFQDLIRYTDGRNRNLGHMLYYGLLEKYNNNFLCVQQHLEQLLAIRMMGQAIPVTLQPTHLFFRTESDTKHIGEHELDYYSMSKDMVKKIWIKPKVQATQEAISAIENASHIIFAPGSIYGSVIVNFLPGGIKKALRKSSARIILITNLVSARNQTHAFTPISYWQLFKKYTGLKQPFHVMIVPNKSRYEFEQKYSKVAADYAREHSYFLGWTPDDFAAIEALGVQVVSRKIYSVTKSLSRLRHDSDKLAKIFKKLF